MIPRIIRPRIVILDGFIYYFYLLRFILELGITLIHKAYYWTYLFDENFDIFDPSNSFYYYNPISNKYSTKNFNWVKKLYDNKRQSRKKEKERVGQGISRSTGHLDSFYPS
jgi:hypothetical protein